MSAAPSTPYRGKSGQSAFMLHRITGFLVFMFLMLHVVDVSLVQNKHLYNEVHAVYGNIVLRLFEVGLLFALVFHALNGLRIVALDFFPDAVAEKTQKRLFGVVLFFTLAAGIPGGYIILRPFIQGHF
ncbi:MAG: succinate dehydrogenase, cytochrome b556 subunit [Acidimicrobiia bacterium]|nr:succinate dehydrogenase, cytochrome b556 subunit [Acidimicrobiia bacterium]